ncbi:MAG: hypothetical protein WC821_01730 [archaeon]|jgi:spore germination protein GerM
MDLLLVGIIIAVFLVVAIVFFLIRNKILSSTGSVSVLIPKTIFSPNEKVEGSLSLTLLKPVNCNEINVTLFAEQKRTVRAPTKNNPRNTRNEVVRIYEYVQKLKDKQNLPATNSEYNFSFIVPQNAKQLETQNNSFNTGLSINLFSMKPNPVKWFIEAKINLAGTFDIYEKKEIQIQ